MSDLYLGDCIEVRSVLADNSVDTIITDPPYGLEFMGKGWDKGVPGVEFWKEFLAVAKPGAMLLAFGGTRTFHRMAVAIEDSGWEIRDCLMWLYSQGFPKSHNFGCNCGGANGQPSPESDVRPVHESDVSPTVDHKEKRGEVLQPSLSQQGAPQYRTEGAESQAAGGQQSGLEGRCNVLEKARQLSADQICSVPDGLFTNGTEGRLRYGASVSDGSAGGSVTEPSRSSAPLEPQSPGQPRRKPRASSKQQKPQVSRMGACLTCGGLRDWRGYGTALKPAFEPIIVAMKPLDGTFAENAEKWGVAGINVDGGRIASSEDCARKPSLVADTAAPFGKGVAMGGNGSALGRWPANLLLDEEAAAMLDAQVNASGARCADGDSTGTAHGRFAGWKQVNDGSFKSVGYGKQSGGASRFFYCAKASKSERNAGCEGLPELTVGDGRNLPADNAYQRGKTPRLNTHPTVKPLKLMEYLCTLTKTPTGGVVLDPFSGSGTTLLAAKNTGREYIGIEQNAEYFEIIKARLGV